VGLGPGQQLGLPLGLAERLLDLDTEPTLAGQGDEVVGHLGRERRRQVGQGHRDQVAPAVAQAAGGQIRYVIELGQGLLHPDPGFLADRGGAVDDIGDGLGRDAGAVGDIAQRRPLPRALAFPMPVQIGPDPHERSLSRLRG
jgi:hypothetical protein